MSSGGWANNDGMFLQYGTAKATVGNSGEYYQPGANRLIETIINVASLSTASPTVLDVTEIFPSGTSIYVEKVELVAQVAMSTTSSPTLSVGICGTNLNATGGSTVLFAGNSYSSAVPAGGGTAFVSSISSTSLAVAGNLVTLTAGSTSAGSYIGDYESSTISSPGYITAQLGTAAASGQILCRIYYHGVGTIPF